MGLAYLHGRKWDTFQIEIDHGSIDHWKLASGMRFRIVVGLSVRLNSVIPTHRPDAC